jgi:cupin fold WbuC family metalloprotein
MKLHVVTPDVLAAPQPIAAIDYNDIDTLEATLAGSSRGRVRIDLHPDRDDELHEMVIAIDSRSYIRPHKHPRKSEAFHLISGTVDISPVLHLPTGHRR